MNIVQEKTDTFNIKAIANTIVLIDTTNVIIMSQNYFSYVAYPSIQPFVAIQSNPITPVVIR